MTYIKRESHFGSLRKGTEEGRFWTPRPDTEVADDRGNEMMAKSRAMLNMLNGYGPKAVKPSP